jgi:hypothetical protein
MRVMDANTKTAGKMADLDPQQQMVSEIWAMIVRIEDKGVDWMKGNYRTAAFTNIWFNRSTDLQRSSAAAAIYQSVIEDITWHEKIEASGSRYLQELHKISAKSLSIKFTVDRYNGNHTSPDFTLGRLTGAIGPYFANEPVHCVLGRQLFPAKGVSNVNYAVAVINKVSEADKKAGKKHSLVLDLANSLQFGDLSQDLEVKKVDNADQDTGYKAVTTTKAIGIVEKRTLGLAINTGTPAQPVYVPLGGINYNKPGWYEQQAGLCTFELSEENLKLAKANPLVILAYESSQTNTLTLNTTTSLVFQESPKYVVADKFVFRLNPQESATVDFYATSLGQPLPKQSIVAQFGTASVLQPSSTDPMIGVPESALGIEPVITTNAQGKATMTLKASDPGNPRKFIDGQIYGITYTLEGCHFADGNPSNFLSILVFDAIDEAIIAKPTWADLQPTMQQYANLYPLMSKGIFNLAKQAVVDQHAQILKLVFTKDKTDPNYMPAVRDLSRDKTQMIVNYLDGVLKKEKEAAASTHKD